MRLIRSSIGARRTHRHHDPSPPLCSIHIFLIGDLYPVHLPTILILVFSEQ